MARDWRTCGVGEHFALGATFAVKFEKDVRCGGSEPIPKDDLLRSLGHGFYNAVTNDQPERAASILDAIEQRLRAISAPATEAAVDKLLDEVSGRDSA